jgi:hypothetical protein
MSDNSTRVLFNMLRQFKVEEEGHCHKEVDSSAVAIVIQMVTLLFDPPKCPECSTPFDHDGGCMSMKCKGRPGVICHAHFCLWCLSVPDLVKLLGPNASDVDRNAACHRHVFVCPLAPPAHSLPGKSVLFPTEDQEHSEWISAWNSLQAINKALKFLREFVAPNTAAGVMADKTVSKIFADAADVVTCRLKKFPQDCRLLKLPSMKLELDLNERHQRIDVYNVSDTESSDDDYIPLPAGRQRMRLDSPPPAIRPPADRAPAWNLFNQNVQFIMDACNCNRRQATDALFANNRDPQKAIEALLE